MKHTRKARAAAPIGRRASFQNPLSFPGIRFVGDGGDGSAVGDGGAPAGDVQGEQVGSIDASKITSNDPSVGGKTITAEQHAEFYNEDGTPKDRRSAEDDEQTGSQADDPKLKAARDEAAQNRIKAREATEQKDALIQQPEIRRF